MEVPRDAGLRPFMLRCLRLWRRVHLFMATVCICLWPQCWLLWLRLCIRSLRRWLQVWSARMLIVLLAMLVFLTASGGKAAISGDDTTIYGFNVADSGVHAVNYGVSADVGGRERALW